MLLPLTFPGAERFAERLGSSQQPLRQTDYEGEEQGGAAGSQLADDE